MASSSTSSIHKNYEYDVFLSFRGEDTRKNFVDHLYDALHRQGIHTFKDDERLEKGTRINDELLKSIEDSRFYIIVFSRNYASSSWCLNELVKIMECNKANQHEQIVFPVFYDVDPSEVRKQLGPVGEALAIHKNEFEVGKWRNVLKEAANLSGWDLKNTADGHEAKVIKQIVETVSLELRSNYMNVDENLVGMEKRIDDLKSSLQIGLNDVRMLGIKGMGGAGKTTLARAIFDTLSNQFEAKSFVENVKDVSKASPTGLQLLQKQVLSDVLRDQGVAVSSVHEGTKLMKTKLCKKVLIVLDDVDHKDQLVALAGDLNWFKPGSRIIITTRDEQVLIAHGVKLIHTVNLLSNDEAIRLFNRHAFGKDVQIQEYKKQSLEVVHYAAGLPLTIKVLGSFLCGKDKPEWIDAVARLKKIPCQETLEKLELSYENLENDYKEIFLDVACFLKGWKKDRGIIMLESQGFHAKNGLIVLQRKCLISISSFMEINMHDHLEEMGKNIIRRQHPNDPNRHSRLWVQEDIENVLANKRGTSGVARCIDLELTPKIALEGLKNQKELTCLIVNHEGTYMRNREYRGNEASIYLPNTLQFLYWQHYPHRCLPKAFQANNLVSLEIRYGNIEQLWEGGKVMKKLKTLVLGFTNIKTCDLGLTPNLERLELDYCHVLEKLDLPIGYLKKLVYLRIERCNRLESLSFIKHVESLEILKLSLLNWREFPDIIPEHCNSNLVGLEISGSDIEKVPSSIGNLHKLVSLDLSYCSKLKTLPRSLCSLQCLKTINLGYSGIEELPENLGNLECLEELDLRYLKVKHLPDSICLLKRLKTLNLEICKRLEKLPEDFGQLEWLEELDLSCLKVKHLPDSICLLKRLKTLNLCLCGRLEKLPEDIGHLECLEELDLSCSKVKHLPDSICLLKRLKTLNLELCERLEKLPEDLGQLESLERLKLPCCSRIGMFPNPMSICLLKHVKGLDHFTCHQLENGYYLDISEWMRGRKYIKVEPLKKKPRTT